MNITWRSMTILLASAALLSSACEEQQVNGETETEVDLIENSAAQKAAANEAVDELQKEAAEAGIVPEGQQPAAAEAGVVFVVWDVDKNQQISQDEFTQGVGKYQASDYFAVWDLDKNDQLNQAELADGLFATWDIDDDEVLNEEEYSQATRDWWGAGWTYGDYSAWNTDTSNPLTPEEFRTGFGKTDILTAWQASDDKNDHLTEEEFQASLFKTWDADSSGYLDRDEFVFELL